MPPAMPQRVIKHRASAMLFDIHHGISARRVGCFNKAGALLGAFCFQQHMQIAMRFEVVKLVGRFERFDPLRQRVRRIGDGDCVRLDRRVRDELATQQIHHERRPARRIPFARIGAIGEHAQHRIGAVERIPPSALDQPCAQGFLRFQ